MYFVFSILIFILIPNAIFATLILSNLVKKISTTVGKFDFLTQPDNFTSLSAPEMIKQENYTSETHNITTEDGYILTIHRIPGRSNSTPVLLQHGLLQCSGDWLIPGKGKSLAYILSDYGYDVWLGNARGNTYSKGHQNLSISDPQFWDFSWEQLGRYDLPAVITYITNLKQDRLFYIGHSMGATTFSVMAIERPDIAKKVKAMIALAPATYNYHLRNFIKLLAPFWDQLVDLSDFLSIYEVLPRNKFFDYLAEKTNRSKLLQNLGKLLLFSLGGFNRAKFNSTLLPRMLDSTPAGTSVKLFIHYLQQIHVDAFRKFDYGSESNMRLYNNSSPPLYDLSKVDVPVAVFCSPNDLFVGLKDVQRFYRELPRQLGFFKIKDIKYSHFDFLWAIDAPQLVYSPVLNVMMKFNDSV